MTTPDEIAQLQQVIKKMEKLAIHRARRMAIGFGILAIAGLLTFVYAFLQQVTAEKNAQEALRQHELAIQSQKAADRNAAEAKIATALAERRQIEREELELKFNQELAKCRGSRK